MSLDASSNVMKLNKTAPIPPLVKGQLWKTEKGHVEIMEVGKIPTHYRLFQNRARSGPSSGESKMVQDYLAGAIQAKLVKNASDQGQGRKVMVPAGA